MRNVKRAVSVFICCTLILTTFLLSGFKSITMPSINVPVKSSGGETVSEELDHTHYDNNDDGKCDICETLFYNTIELEQTLSDIDLSIIKELVFTPLADGDYELQIDNSEVSFSVFDDSYQCVNNSGYDRYTSSFYYSLIEGNKYTFRLLNNNNQEKCSAFLTHRHKGETSIVAEATGVSCGINRCECSVCGKEKYSYTLPTCYKDEDFLDNWTFMTGEYNGFVYSIVNNVDGSKEAIVHSFSCDIGPEVVFPSEIDGVPVRAIGSFEEDVFYRNVFEDHQSVTSIVIPETVKTLYVGAIPLCSNLEEITIPDSVNCINEFTFLFCPLNTVNLGKGLRIISSEAFARPEYWDLVVNNFIGEMSIDDINELFGTSLTSVDEVYDYISENPDQIKNVLINSGIQEGYVGPLIQYIKNFCTFEETSEIWSDKYEALENFKIIYSGSDKDWAKINTGSSGIGSEYELIFIGEPGLDPVISIEDCDYVKYISTNDVKCIVTDQDSAISEVYYSINKIRRVPVNLSDNKFSVSSDLFEEGENTITITAYDTEDNKTIQTFSVIKDLISPTIAFNQDNSNNWKTEVIITGTVLDNISGIKKVEYTVADGEKHTLSLNDNNEFAIDDSDLPDGECTVTVYAADNARNLSTSSVSYKKDTTAPVIESVIDTPHDTWTKKSTVSIDASDSYSGLDYNAYSFDGGLTWQTDNFKDYDENTELNQVIMVRDALGNTAIFLDVVSLTKIDTTKPSIIIPVDDFENWEATFDVEGNVNDDASGIARVYYSIDNSSINEVNIDNGVFTITGNDFEEGTHNIEYTVVDNAGNESNISFVYKKDATPPSVVIRNENTYSNWKQEISVEADITDSYSGVKSVSYRIDGGEKTYANLNEGVLSIADNKLPEGEHTFTIYATDYALNESETDLVYKKDSSSPVISSINDDQNGQWQKKNTLTVSASDNLSGLDLMPYSFDGGNTWQSSPTKDYYENITIPSNTILVRDSAGNVCEYTHRIEIAFIDSAAPTITSVESDRTEVSRLPVTITVIASDTISGLANDAYSFDGGNTWQSSPEIIIKKNTVIPSGSIRVKDKAENVAVWNEEVTIDNIIEHNLALTVVDTFGAPVPDANVYLNFGTSNQYVVQSDSDGMVKTFLNAAQSTIGVLKNGYLPSTRTVSLSETFVTEITIEIEQRELVEGGFDIRRMTEEEITEAGINLDDPENQYACEVVADFYFTPASPESHVQPHEYHYHQIVIFPGLGEDYILPLPRDPEDVNHEIFYYIPYPGDHGTNVGEEVDIIPYGFFLIIEVPIKATCAKEFFNVNLTVINNASESFNISENELKLMVPEGLTLMEGYDGYDNATTTFDSFRGQEIKQFSWIVRGDEKGTYNLTGKYTGTLDGFGAKYDCEFVSDDITVYDMSNLTMIVSADTYVIGGAWAISVALRNDGDIDIYRPNIYIEDHLVWSYEEWYYEKNGHLYYGSHYLHPKVTLRNYFEIEPGEDKGHVKIPEYPKTLSPGQTIGASYVMTGVSTVPVVWELKSAFVREVSGYGLRAVEFDFSGNGGTVHTCNVGNRSFPYPLEYYLLQTSSTVYNPELADMLMWFADSAYVSEEDYGGTTNETCIEKTYKSFGFDTYQTYHYKESALENTGCAYSIARKELLNGRTLVMITVRGTTGDPGLQGEWLGDFQVFSPSIALGNGWHPNFEACARDIFNQLSYNHLLNKSGEYIYCLTGHSKGAAVANLTAVLLDDYGIGNNNVYDYNFACPDVAVKPHAEWSFLGKHDNIFNINNASDLITYLPALLGNHLLSGGALNPYTEWGKYGISKWFSHNWEDDLCTNVLSFVSNLMESGGIPFKYYSSMYSKVTDKELKKNAKEYTLPHNQIVYLAYTENKYSLSSMYDREYSVFKSGEKMVELSATAISNSPFGPALDAFFVCISCPVDFTIQDKDGNILASCIGNKPTYYESKDHYVLICVDGDRKGILITNSEGVNIDIVGTDSGTMRFEADYLYNTLNNPDSFAVSYEDVSLNEGKKMQYTFSDIENLDENILFVVDKNDLPTAIIESDGSETPVQKYHTLTFVADGKTVSEKKLNEGEPIVKPSDPVKEGYSFKRWIPDIPDSMPAKDMTFTAVFEKNTTPDETNQHEEPSKPDFSNFKIKNYSSSLSVDYKSTVIFHTTIEAPSGYEIVWSTNVKGSECRLNSVTDKEYKVSARMVNKTTGEAEAVTEEVTVKVNTGFFAKIIAFFRGLFGSLPTYEDFKKK